MFTIDASVWVNAYSPAEPQQPASLALLTTLIASGTKIVVPTLLPIELAGVIARTRSDLDLAQKMATSLRGLPFLHWVPLDEPFAEHASQLAANHRLRGADAVYVSVAQLHGCALISLDKEHLSRLAGIVRTMMPAEALAEIKQQQP